MKKFILFTLCFFVCLAMPLSAQDQEMQKPEAEMSHMMPPQALDDDWSKWLVGEWEGSSESAKGKSQEWEKYSFGLDNQFLFSESKSVTGPMTYQGMGATTINVESGAVVGYWIDNWRGMYEGSGTREGDKLTMEWKGAFGTYQRVMQKVADDKYTASWSFTDPSGNKSEGTTEMTKKQMMTNK
jgi:hypothetical protein